MFTHLVNELYRLYVVILNKLLTYINLGTELNLWFLQGELKSSQDKSTKFKNPVLLQIKTLQLQIDPQ